jgi:hypothetical protein
MCISFSAWFSSGGFAKREACPAIAKKVRGCSARYFKPEKRMPAHTRFMNDSLGIFRDADVDRLEGQQGETKLMINCYRPV